MTVLAVIFVVGIVTGIITVLALAAVRADRRGPLTGRSATSDWQPSGWPDEDEPDDPLRWPVSRK